MNAFDRDAFAEQLAALDERRVELCGAWGVASTGGRILDVEAVAAARPGDLERQWRAVVDTLLGSALLEMMAAEQAAAAGDLPRALMAFEAAVRRLERVDMAAYLRNTVGFDPMALAEAHQRSRAGAALGGRKAAARLKRSASRDADRVMAAVAAARARGVPETGSKGAPSISTVVAAELGCTRQHVNDVRRESGDRSTARKQ